VPLIVGLCACSVGPAYRKPVIPPPAAWSTRAAPSATVWPAADWWRGFNSTELNGYIDRARQYNDDIGAAVARVQEAYAQARIAGAPLYPSLTAGAAASRVRGFAPPRTALYTEYTPTLSASYEVDFWGSNRAAHNAALFAAQASSYDEQTVALGVLASVATTYFEVLETHDRLGVAQNNLSNAQHILDGFELEQKVGVATALDVAQQAAVVAGLNALIPPLEQQLRQYQDALAVLLGMLPESLQPQGAGLEQLTPPAVIEGLPSELLARRPDVAEAEAQLRSSNANIVVARAAFFPSLNLTASGGFASEALASLITPQARVFALSAALSQTIFQGGARVGQYRYTQARYAELLSDYHKAVISAFGNVEDALISVQQSAEQLVRQQDATDTAQTAFQYAQQQLQAGVTNILTVLNTETTLFTAEDELVQVRFARLQALVQLYQALGGGWQTGQEAR
jgi:NodT family efflux transporter outer membrane factor (OMF) lipoprotein